MSKRLVLRLLVSLLSIAVVAALGITAYVMWPRPPKVATNSGSTAVAGASVTSSTTSAAAVDPVISPPTPRVKPEAVNAGKKPVPAKVAARLADPLHNPRLGQFHGLVVDPATNTTLWHSANYTAAVTPGSTMKLLTGAAVLTSLDPASRLTTKVVQGTKAGDIVLVGGGDPTLSAATEAAPTVYTGAPTVADLAAQIKASGIQVQRILTDTTLWDNKATTALGWSIPGDITGTDADSHGYATNMLPLMVDGDRKDPSNENSIRTGVPDQTAAAALARALGNPNLPVVTGQKAPANGKVLAAVQSQPISILLTQALVNSDNVLAEALGRAMAIKRGAPPSFDGMVSAIGQALGDLKLDTSDIKIFDASGLSDKDLVPPTIIAQIISLALSGKVPNLSLLLSGLPVAGVSGTLNDRFTDRGSKFAAGWVRAKTGTVATTYALAGYVLDTDGRVLVFAFNSNNAVAATRPAQDDVAAALRKCGCS